MLVTTLRLLRLSLLRSICLLAGWISWSLGDQHHERFRTPSGHVKSHRSRQVYGSESQLATTNGRKISTEVLRSVPRFPHHQPGELPLQNGWWLTHRLTLQNSWSSWLDPVRHISTSWYQLTHRWVMALGLVPTVWVHGWRPPEATTLAATHGDE